ncbi:MAG: helix-turn-helix transcriptional regulator [Cytophagales bacterium]|nr:helix-turn-helix transcriptional regulator [Cytophagales bacterium]
MITREELIQRKEFWMTKIQNDLFANLEDYMNENKLTRTQLAQKLGVTKGYITQVLNGDFDNRISKLIELSLFIGKAPVFTFDDLGKYIKKGKAGKDNSVKNTRAVEGQTVKATLKRKMTNKSLVQV